MGELPAASRDAARGPTFSYFPNFGWDKHRRVPPRNTERRRTTAFTLPFRNTEVTPGERNRLSFACGCTIGDYRPVRFRGLGIPPLPRSTAVMACGAALGVFADGVDLKAYRRVLANCTSAPRSQWCSLSNRTVGLLLLALGADWAHSTAIERSAMMARMVALPSSVVVAMAGSSRALAGSWADGAYPWILSGPSDAAGVAQVRHSAGPVAGRQSPLW